jgi:LPS-assembly protein
MPDIIVRLIRKASIAECGCSNLLGQPWVAFGRQETGNSYVRAAKLIAVNALFCAAMPCLSAERADDGRGISCWPEVETPAEFSAVDTADAPIEITAGDADISVGGDATLQGPIELRRAGRSLGADTANYDSETKTFNATGGITYQDPLSSISGESASYNTLTNIFNFSDAEFEFQDAPARGSASSVKVKGTGELELKDVIYTSCPAGNDDWILRANSLDVDMNSGMGTARGASIAFKGVPFIYVPYFTYPVTGERKSGLLFPKLGSSDRRGVEYSQPIYWNIAPNYDATIVPRYMSDRGTQLGSEVRFLTQDNDGILWGDYLSDDDETGTDRWQYDVFSQSALPWDWRATVRARGVSDDDYFDDMTSSRTDTSRTNLSRQLDLEYYNRHWSLFARTQDFQTIDPEIVSDDEPYSQLPQFVANGEWLDGLFGLDYALDTETAYFYREDSVNGARLHIQPEISLPIESRGLYLIPEVAFDYTGYQLSDQSEDARDNPSRAAPIYSVDSGAIFDRVSGSDDQWLITLEPRAQYTYIPYKDQDDIPIFDTIAPDFNFVQLFRKNRYVGYDRLGDTSQLSWGLTSRVLDSNDGRELLTATVGQTQFFDNGTVTLSDEEESSNNSSDYIAELGVNVWGNWNIDMRMQWDSDESKTERSSVGLRYKPGDKKAFNVAYRYADGSLEQTDVSFTWPLGDSWNFLGRHNYSLLESTTLDQYVGVEYTSCCWGLGLVHRRSIARSSGETDSSISLQFQLKGFSSLGSESSGGLQEDILGSRRY